MTPVRDLLKKGADARVKDTLGWTALRRAQDLGHKQIETLLKAYGAKE